MILRFGQKKRGITELETRNRVMIDELNISTVTHAE
jgi:hypothetical protein